MPMSSGAFCLITIPSGILITFSVTDVGALIPTVGSNGHPIAMLYVGGFQITSGDDGALHVAASSVPSAISYPMVSPAGYSFILTVDPSDTSVHITPSTNIVQTRTLKDLLISVLRTLGIIQEGNQPSASQLSGAESAMNFMLYELDSAIIYATTSEDFTLSPGKATYSIGLNGDFDTDRPINILDECYVRDASTGTTVDYPLKKIGQAAYNSIDVKDVQSIPENFFYDPQYPLGIITFYYIPDKAYTFHCVSNKNITEITNLTAPIILPPEHRAFLKWNTAKVLAADYPGASSLPNYANVILPMARRSMTMIQRINAANKVEEAYLDCPKPQRQELDWRGPFLSGRTY